MLRRNLSWLILLLIVLLTVLATVPASAALSPKEKRQIAEEIMVECTQLFKMGPAITQLSKRFMEDPKDAAVRAECISLLKDLYPTCIRTLQRVDKAGRDDIRFFYMMLGVYKAAECFANAAETLKEACEAPRQMTEFEVKRTDKMAKLFVSQGDSWSTQSFMLLLDLGY